VSHITDPSSPPLLVGRERELGVLRQHLTASLNGRGSLVLIGGEAGIGKTALAETLCREVTEQGAIVLTGRSFDLTETPPYGPWLYLFARSRPDHGLPPLPPAFSAPGVVGAVASQAALHHQVLAFLTASTERRPVVLLLDDAQWFDPASLDLVRFLGQAIDTLPLLVLVTYRCEDLHGDHPLSRVLPLLVREAHADRLDLHPLDACAIDALILQRYRLPDTDADRLVAYLQDRAEGNALFVGELLRACEERDVLREVGGGWLLGPLTETGVPPLLRQVIDTRVARLDAESQRLLAMAAVIGQEVPFAVWATVASADEEALLDAVAEADAAHLMAETTDGSGAVFAHALVREAIYESIRPSQRRQWHRTVGETLAAAPAADPDTVASHFQRAGDRRALAWLLAAGERAQQAWAWLGAATRFEMALALMGDDTSTASERGWLIFRLALLRRYGDPGRALINLDAAARLAAAIDDPLLTAQVQFYRGNIRCLTGDLRAGLPDMAAGVAALATLPSIDFATHPGIDLMSVAHARVGYYTWLGSAGRLAEARAIGEQVVAEVVAFPPDEMSDIGYGWAVSGLAHIYAYQGEVEASRRAYVAAIAEWRARDIHLLVGVATMLSLLWRALPYCTEDVAERRRLTGEAEAAWARGSEERAAVPARFTHAPVLFIEGQWDEARTLALSGHRDSGG
jgi:hypothetical protein